MTQENKELLLKDLCTRLPYEVRGLYQWKGTAPFDRELTGNLYDELFLSLNSTGDSLFTPYLRPLSSMTEEEKREFQSFYPGCFGNQWLDVKKGEIEIFECSSTIKLYLNNSAKIVDWLNAHHFDYRGLIEKGLALEAPEGMYKTE